MSSHHIVTDNQEPAIFITDKYFNTSVLEGLLEWGSRLIVSFPALKRVVELGIKVDEVLCAPNEKLEAESLLKHQFPHFKISERKHEQLEQDIVQFLRDSSVDSFNILTTLEGIYYNHELYSSKDNIVVYQQKTRCIAIKENSTYSKWFLKGTEIKLSPIINREANFYLKNLAETGTEKYKVVETGIVTIKVSEGTILVCHDVS